MQIQIKTDHNTEGTERLVAHVRELVEGVLHRFGDRTTRVDVHISGQRGDKGSLDDKRCVMEGRLQGHQPIAVRHRAATVDQAVHGAADKLKRALESTVKRRQNHHTGETAKA